MASLGGFPAIWHNAFALPEHLRHIHRYLAEFDFRYSNRIAMGIDDGVRSVKVLMSVKGRRLTYRKPVAV